MRKCDGCPIKGTEHCHRLNPMAKKYTRFEKEMLREEMDKGQSAYKEIENPAILQDEHTCDIYFKPNLKGGHTHNHLKNMELRLMLTKKEIKALRKIMKRGKNK